MRYLALIVPLLFVGVFIVATVRKVKVYDAFTQGVKGAIPLIVGIFPYLAAIFMLTELFERSGLSALLCDFLAPAFEFFGVPREIIRLLIVKPFSGSGSTAVFTEIVETYGADSYIARCAAVCYGSSETVFYIGAVYFSAVKEKRLAAATAIALVSSLIAAAMGCLFCRIM